MATATSTPTAVTPTAVTPTAVTPTTMPTVLLVGTSTTLAQRPVSSSARVSATRVAAPEPLPGRAGEVPAPRTAAGERALRRRRARVSADRRPPSGVLPSARRTAAVVSADHGDQVADRPFRMGRLARLFSTLCMSAAAAAMAVVLLSSGDPQVTDEVTVGPGDSLWSIAEQADPGADPRAVVDQIRRLNGLGGDVISVGAVLQVPTAAR